MYAVVIASQAVGGGLIILVALGLREPFPTLAALGWGAIAGVAGAVGLLALYRGLAAGRMGLVAPVSAVVAAALPVLVSAWLEGLPNIFQWLGFALALISVWLLSRPEKMAFQLRDLGLPLLAGAGFGLFFVLIDQANNQGVFWPLTVARTASLLVLFVVTLGLRQPQWPPRPAWGICVLSGVLDAGGNVFYTLAAQMGRLDMAAVLASLYPAATVALAWLLLKERLNKLQLLGVGAALVAIGLITL